MGKARAQDARGFPRSFELSLAGGHVSLTGRGGALGTAGNAPPEAPGPQRGAPCLLGRVTVP